MGRMSILKRLKTTSRTQENVHDRNGRRNTHLNGTGIKFQNRIESKEEAASQEIVEDAALQKDAEGRSD
jgi:hypothetical protein